MLLLLFLLSVAVDAADEAAAAADEAFSVPDDSLQLAVPSSS